MRRGLSLIETVLAIAMLIIAYLPLADLLSLTRSQTVASRNQLVAQQLALSLFELYPSHRGAFLPESAGTNFQLPDALASSEARALLTREAPEILDAIKASQMKVACTFEAGVDGKPLERVDVTVEWSEDGHARDARFFRLLPL